VHVLVVDPTCKHATNLRVVLSDHAVADAASLPDQVDADVVVVCGPNAANLCALLRARDEAIAILVLTERGLVEDRVAGLRAGADDALEVPFAAAQAVARVDALGRRARLVPKLAELVEADGCMVDLSRCIAVRDGRVTQLSAREVGLIRWLHRHRGRTVERREILEHVFGVSPDVETRSVDMAIATLRKKLERDVDHPAIIVSVKGLGYAWYRPS
jgi:DNA-binding response OmpR family regulator